MQRIFNCLILTGVFVISTKGLMAKDLGLRESNTDKLNIFFNAETNSNFSSERYEYKSYAGDFAQFMKSNKDRNAFGLGVSYFLNTWAGAELSVLWAPGLLLVDDQNCAKIGGYSCGGNSNIQGVLFTDLLKFTLGPSFRFALFNISDFAFVSLVLTPGVRYSSISLDSATTNTLFGISGYKQSSLDFVVNVSAQINFGNFSQSEKVAAFNSLFLSYGLEYTTANLRTPSTAEKYESTNLFLYVKAGVGLFSVTE